MLTARLAERCDALLAVDAAQAAADAARASGSPAVRNVTVERRELPEDFPAGPFELIVCSEVLYYLDAARVRRDARGDRGASSTGQPARRPLAPGHRAPTRSAATRSTSGSRRASARPRYRDRTPEYALDRFDVA